MTGKLEQTITCHFCFEEFDIDVEINEDFTGFDTEIYDCVVCCNPNKLSYQSHIGKIISLTVSDGNE